MFVKGLTEEKSRVTFVKLRILLLFKVNLKCFNCHRMSV